MHLNARQFIVVHLNAKQCTAMLRIMRNGPIRVFVGSDARMGKAELVLEYSLRKHCSQPIDITWMRAVKGDKDWGECWDRGREMYKPYTGNLATDFTTFRFCVPELCNFTGKAIYLDSDMFVRRDIAELWNIKTTAGFSCVGPRTDVALLQCGRFAFPEWPSIAGMKKSGWKIGEYCKLLSKYNQFDLGSLPSRWDNLDGRGFNPDKVALVHFTRMQTQPWKPWPECFPYTQPHPCKEVVDEFWSLHREATAAQAAGS